MAWQRSFRPLTGMVPSACFWNNRKVGFRPLTGMVQKGGVKMALISSFRPLAGMVRHVNRFTTELFWFSPPYGDGTLDAEKARLSTVVFAPLRG